MSNASKGTALITGASAGIGAVYADRLAKRGYDLILVARNADRLNQVAERIRHESGRSVQVIAADLGNTEDLQRVEARLKNDESISLLVNNAGFGSKESVLEASVDEMTAMIDLNVTALTRLTYAVAPAMAARRQGTIINIASIVAIAPELLNGVYGASKAYVLALTHSLQHELAESGVRIQAVLPGATATDFWNIAGVGGHENLPQDWVMRTEDMVDAALVGLDAGEKVTIPALQEGSDWDNWEAERRAVSTRLSAAQPAPRYVR
ncbi:Serine 3-dehydrogenase [Cedecea lapagei]|uniref:NADP-dependent 3-hydroxy acid dehydrogenase YdfG n=1 Tax=Cedecea lapagei TaxID=158823 RepID=A0A3S5DPR5_9ENTR|nr:SDR family oxidoreductase [Cedecea lapagei]VEB97877.1 Serine 3-dehydrogenase [Cedecea lapagei]